MKKHSDNPLETFSLSAIEHLLQHRPEIIRSLRIADRPTPRWKEIEALARKNGIKPVVEKGLGEGEGAIALLAPAAYLELKPLIAALADRKRTLLVALDHVQDPQNFGAICRTAEALGAQGLMIPKNRIGRAHV